MTRSELIEALTRRFPNLMAKDAEIAVKEILDAIGVALTQGNRVEIRGFGSFGLNYRPARNARNPKSGEKVLVLPKYVPHFKAGKEMRDRVEASMKQVPLPAQADREGCRAERRTKAQQDDSPASPCSQP